MAIDTLRTQNEDDTLQNILDRLKILDRSDSL